MKAKRQKSDSHFSSHPSFRHVYRGKSAETPNIQWTNDIFAEWYPRKVIFIQDRREKLKQNPKRLSSQLVHDDDVLKFDDPVDTIETFMRERIIFENHGRFF
jgi:hypothetical protein